MAGALDLPPDFDPEVPSREVVMQQLRSFGKPMAQEALARAVGATIPLSIGFERRLRAMERDGQLFLDRHGKLQVNTKLEFFAGRVQGHRDGFGFLLRDDGGPDLFLALTKIANEIWPDIKATGGGATRSKLRDQLSSAQKNVLALAEQVAILQGKTIREVNAELGLDLPEEFLAADEAAEEEEEAEE